MLMRLLNFNLNKFLKMYHDRRNIEYKKEDILSHLHFFNLNRYRRKWKCWEMK